jgi:4'-phosphopantetheinyl transferase
MTLTSFTATTAAPVRSGAHGARDGTVVCRIWSLAPLRRPMQWFGLLDEAERSRAAAFVHESDLSRFVTGRVLAKTALASLVGSAPEAISLRTRCSDCGGPHGKPQPAGPAEGWELSISHSADVVAVGVARGTPLGLDVERLDPWSGPGLPPEYELVLTPRERAAVEALPESRRARACLAYWTRKEAVLKALGEGLATPMTDFTLSGPTEPPALLDWRQPASGRPVPAIADVSLADGYHAAVAVLGAVSVRATVRSGAALLHGAARRRRAHEDRADPP